VGRMAVTTTAYELGAGVLGTADTSWVAGEGSVSIGVEDGSLVHLEAGLMGGQGKVRNCRPSWKGRLFSGLGPW